MTVRVEKIKGVARTVVLLPTDCICAAKPFDCGREVFCGDGKGGVGVFRQSGGTGFGIEAEAYPEVARFEISALIPFCNWP